MERQTLFRGNIVIGMQTTAMGFWVRGKKLGSTQYNKEKWEFIDKEHNGGQWMGNYEEETPVGEGILGKGRSGWSDTEDGASG